MKKLFALLSSFVLVASTGCTSAEAKADLIAAENVIHIGVVDLEEGMEALAQNPGAVDSVESFIAPFMASNAALAKANAEFVALWTAYKAGKVGPSGSPVTVADLRMSLALLDSLTAATVPDAATTAKRKEKKAAMHEAVKTAKRPVKAEEPPK